MKKRVGLFFGGPSNEHEVSILSALNISKNLDADKYSPVFIYWDKEGQFFIVSQVDKLDKKNPLAISDFKKNIDVAFPITHGKYGEDGVLQAILESQKISYAGCHVLSSALCMDKGLFKNFMASSDILQAKFIVLDFVLEDNESIKSKLDSLSNFALPLFIKPANSGSSVGVTKIDNLKNVQAAIDSAKKHDPKIIIEEGFTGHKEIEVAVLGNSGLKISRPGQLILPPDNFYDYDEKYKLNRTQIKIPAEISAEEERKAISLAEKTYRLCCCSGFARIDMFVKDGVVYINEINTLPGFTDISMFPMLMQNLGIPYKQLVSEIIELAY